MADTNNSELDISEEHWAIIESAPVAAFLLIAGADGTVDRKELKVFARRLAAGLVGKDDSPIMAVAVQRASFGLEDRLDQLSKKSARELAKLVAVSRHAIHQDAGAEAADVFSKSLYAMVYQVARASGGMLGLGSKIDKNEKIVLGGLKRVLKIGD